MTDFMAGRPDDISARLAEDAHRPGDAAGALHFLAAEGHPGESLADGDGRDDRLADFAQDRCGDAARPNAWHVMVLNDLTGPDDRCPGATDDKATAAQELILAGLDDCKTWADLLRLVQRAACEVDPDGARRRRKEAERQSARVRLWRESSGACALAGHSLPADEALTAWGQV